MEKALFGKRFLAALSDLCILLVVTLPLFYLFSSSEGFVGKTPDGAMGLAMLFFVGIPLLYSLTEIFLAQTPGKMLNKIKIKNYDGTDATMNSLILRWFLKYAASHIPVILGMYGIQIGAFGIIFMIWTWAIFFGCFLALSAKRQTLHDLLSKTAVFHI